MTEKTRNNLLKGFGLFLSVWTVLVGVAFIVQVWRVYAVGDKAFTVERIGAYFRQIAVPVYIWLVAVAVTGVLWLAFPVPQKKIVPYVELKCTLARLNKRLTTPTEEMKKKQKQRVTAYLVCAVFVLVCAIVALVYMLADYEMLAKKGFLAEHQESERILRALVWVLAGIALAIATVYYVQNSYHKEIQLVKTEIAENAKKGVKAQPQEEKTTLKSGLTKKFAFLQSKRFMLGLRIAVAVVAVIFIVTGIRNGGMLAMLDKAINICSQCIGIG